MRQTDHNPLIQRIVWLFLKLYVQVYHRFESRFAPAFPERPPYLAITSHFSVLDVVALIVADPFHPYSTLVVKESATRVPVIRGVLRAFGAVSVARDGRDLGPLRDVLHVLSEGRGICIAAHGVRSRSGHLDALDPVLVKLALRVAAKGVPILPIVETGTFEAMPPGAWFPRPSKIRVIGGDPIDLSPWCGRRVGDAELFEVAALIQAKIAALLPLERRPIPGTPPLDLRRLEQKSRVQPPSR